ncbi:hypothetical protein [Leptolyngbya sp. NIES-2104]|uniref:hypothetical protein n=1 Tax=Leptolyngbya sp. NIES-2104 TaxID=1552121 RepID=UPI0006EC9D21|nr:hypothetical protein [Leptolyngbya sp. NIES-2104]GAP96364.1 hypothetical protein NIES2104_29010 [Leptolyngbya sp. NIES-2104]
MNDWQKDWFEMFDTIADQVEGFLIDVAQDMTDAMNDFVEFSEEVSMQLNTTFIDELEQSITVLVSPILEAYFGIGGAIEEITQPMTQTVEPMLKQHPACVGCRHFHGQYYGDSLLVCGMHPYGMEAGVETCPDKEAVNWGMFHSDDSEHW